MIALVNGQQRGSLLQTDGWKATPEAGMRLRFYGGDERTVLEAVVGANGSALVLLEPVAVVDNAGIWLA